MKKLDSFTLKIIAMIFMLMDHILTYIGTGGGVNIPMWFGYFGKIAAPIFFFLIVEGFFHTRSKNKYMLRLFAFSGVMLVVDYILGIHNNIFLSLGLSVTLLTCIDKAKETRRNNENYIIWVMFSVITLAVELFTEASFYGVTMTLIFYFLREKKGVMGLVYIICSIIPVFTALGNGELFLESILVWDYQWMMVFAIIPILMYNGKLGINNKFTKWMFYCFYPIHLIAVVLIGRI